MAYNTVPFHGKTARSEKNDVAISFTEGWQIDAEVDFDDTTPQGDNWEDQVAGYSRWTGSISGWLVLGNTEQKALFDNIVTATPGVKLTDMKFLLDGSTNAFTGDIHVTGFSLPATKEGSVKMTINFKGSGALSVTDSA